MKPLHTNRHAVRRFLLETQHLLYKDETRHTPDPEAVLQMIRSLECVQLDPVAAVERNQHLVLAARIPGYEPKLLNQLLSNGRVFEYWANAACAIPIEDYPMFEPTRNRLQSLTQSELNTFEPVVEEVLHRLEVDGPLPARAFRSTERVHGYWDNKQPKTKATSHVLNLLLDSGTIRVVRREGNERFFHLTERTVPSEYLSSAQSIETMEANQLLLEKYLRAYRVFDFADARFGWQKMSAAKRRAEVMKRVEMGDVIPLQIDDVRRPYFILASDLDRLRQHGQESDDHVEGPIRFLPPLDNLLWRRDRLVDLFDFTYKWEIYTPKEKRQFGYYAMPILAGDRLIGRMDPGLDRKQNQLVVRFLHIEPGIEITEELRCQLRDAMGRFAEFHGVQNIVVERIEPATLHLE